MRTAFVLTVATAAALCLSACQKPAANNAASNSAAASGSTATAPAAPSMGETTLTADQMPHRKPGLWKMHTTISDIGRPMDDTQCVGPDTDKIDLADKRAAADHKCNPTFARGLDGSYHGTANCQVEGKVQMAMDIRAAGDFNSHYKVHVETTLSGAPIAAINGKHTSDIEATWVGPCTPDRHGG